MSIVGKRKKKVFCLVLTGIYLLVNMAIISPTAVFAANSYEYSPQRQKYAIAPGALYANEDFYNSYVKTDAVWAFNSITYFTGNALNYNTEKVGYIADFSKSLQDFDPFLESLRKKGDLLVNFRVSLANNGNYRQSAALKYIKGYMGNQFSSEYRNYGDRDYVKYKWGSINLNYQCSAAGLGSRMKNSSLVFADATSPKMQEIYASSTIDGPSSNLFNINSQVAYIHVKFDENIRFSDNNRNNDNTTAAHNNIYLKLKVSPIGGTTILGAGQMAKFVRLKNDTLTFRYDIPDSINGDNMNHCISGIEGIMDYDKGGADGVNALNNSYPLRVLTYTGELYGHYTNSGLVSYSTSSLITDAAGNPADTALASMKNSIYIDKVSPYVEKVSLDAPENKAGYVGPGCGITPTVTFNESLHSYKSATGSYVPINSPGKFSATLNIKNQSGNYLTVSGNSFSNDNKTLTFNTLTLPDGMTLDGTDSKIRITSISLSDIDYNSILPVDARGNALENPISLFPDPADQFIPDAGDPVIATDFNITSGEYTPAAYDSDNDAKSDSFYFSFGLTDAGSGVQPSGAGANLKGGFKWTLNGTNNAATDIDKLTFKYAFVLSSTEPPSQDQQWYEGRFGRDYTFTQLGRNAGAADNIYLHIKADGLEGADLDESTLSITAGDLVGNSGTKEFILDGSEINSLLDHTPPDITVNRMDTYKDTADGDKWKFAADFTLKDISGVDTGKVYSQWVEKGTAPSAGGWAPVPGLGSDEEEVPATVEYILTDGAMNSRDLYIKAADCSNNANVRETGPYAFARDLTKPVFESSYSVDATTKAALMVDSGAQSATVMEGGVEQEIPAVILVTIGDSYKAIDLSSPVSVNIFNDGDGWYNTVDGSSSTDSTLISILNGTYYGKIDVRVNIGYGIFYREGVIQDPYYSLGAEEWYTLYTAPALNPIHDITMSSSLVEPGGGWSSPAEGAKYYTDPAGLTFNVLVENFRINGWGSKDVDFENSFFAIYKTIDGTPVFTAPIGMASKITIPEGLNLSDGSYYAKATVTAKTSGHVDESNTLSIQIDRTQPEDFGLSGTETLWHPSGDPADPDVGTLFGKIGTDTVLYGYDSVYNSGAAAYESVPTVFLGSADNGLAAPTRKLYFTTKSTNNEFYIKVWNASAGVDEVQSKAAARWQSIRDSADSTGGAGFSALIVGSAVQAAASYSADVIPVINNTENIIKYQICHANGTESVEKVMLAEVSDEAPELEVSLTPETLPSSEVMAKVTRLYSPHDLDMQVFYWAGGSTGAPVAVAAAADENGNISLLQEDDNWFFTSNIYGNYTILNKQAANLDADAPVLSSTGFSQDGDMYKFSVTIKDKSSWDLLMKFDNIYMTRLGLSEYFRLEVPEPEVPESEVTWVADSPRSDGIYKIVRTDSPDGIANLVITGVYLYDNGGGSPPATADLTYSLLARDAVGNESIIGSGVCSVKNARPELSLGETTVTEDVNYNPAQSPNNLNPDGTMDLYSMRASFNLPVKNVTPLQYHRAENCYGFVKDFLNIFRDGTYTVTYDDIFGKRYQEEKTVTINNDMNITMTGLNAQNQYNLSAVPAVNEGRIYIPANEGKAFTAFADTYDATLTGGGYARAVNVRRNDMLFDRNETVIIAMMIYRSAYSGWFLDDSTPLILIDGSTRQAPTAEVHWYYHEFASDTLPSGEIETDGEVDVWVTSDTPLTGANGKLLSHTFTFDDMQDSSYTFEYANSDGITGSTTVILPVTIVQNKEQQGDGEFFPDDSLGINGEDLYKTPPDTTPPGVILSVFGKHGSFLGDKGSWYSESGENMGALFTWASGFVLQADIIDDSKTKIILLKGADADISGITYGNAQSSAIQGVVLDRNNIRVTAQVTGQYTEPATASVTYPEAFTVLLIDESDNKKAISFPANVWGQLDIIAPWLYDLSYTKTDFTKVDATFKLKDDKTAASQIELLSPNGLTYDPATGVYTMTFTENKQVQTVLRDLAGNMGDDTVKVENLDDQLPEVTDVWWSKGYVDDEGVYDPTHLTLEKTNQTVTAILKFNKPIKEVVVTNVRDGNYDLVPSADQADYVAWTWDTNNVVVDFLKNASISFSFVAANGRENSYSLNVGVIDKSVPVVTTLIDDRTTATTATVTFSNPSDGESVRAYGPGETGERIFEPGDVLTKTFTKQGTYIYRFTDEAGNTRTENVKIENIDEYPPGILAADLPPAGTYYSDSVSFKATMSEAGTLTFNGDPQTVAAPVDTDYDGTIDADVNNNGKVDSEDNECDWVTFTATQNGNFPITAIDAAGRRTTAYVAINCFDKAGPVISFNPTTITVMSGTNAPSFLALLEQGVTVADNSTAVGDIILTHGDVSVVNLSIPGQYQVAFTATDLAGNVTSANRYVKVFSASEVNVVVNGRRTESKNTTVMKDLQVTLEISKLPMGDNEPYKVYLRKGIWTAGHMKEAKSLTQTGSFTLPEQDSFYTLYIVTQNRGTYLTYLYTQE